MAFLRFLAIKYYVLINFERKMVENSELLVFLGDFKKCRYYFFQNIRHIFAIFMPIFTGKTSANTHKKNAGNFRFGQ